jgi:hypothetical protein
MHQFRCLIINFDLIVDQLIVHLNGILLYSGSEAVLSICHVAVFAARGVGEFVSIPKTHTFIVFMFETATSLVVCFSYSCVTD